MSLNLYGIRELSKHKFQKLNDFTKSYDHLKSDLSINIDQNRSL